MWPVQALQGEVPLPGHPIFTLSQLTLHHLGHQEGHLGSLLEIVLDLIRLMMKIDTMISPLACVPQELRERHSLEWHLPLLEHLALLRLPGITFKQSKLL